MAENNDITKKREMIKAEIQAGKYRSLASIILYWTGRFIQKIAFAKKPPSFWYNSAVFAAFTLLVSALIAVLADNPMPDARPEIRANLILAGLLGVLGTCSQG